MTSMFDPAQFLDASLSGELKKRPLVKPEVYTAVIGEPRIRTWQGRQDPSKSGYAIDIPLSIQLAPDEATRVGQQSVTLTDGGFLDTTDQGGIDMAPGRNRLLRTYYEATGLNKAGTTPRMLQGRTVRVQVVHGVFNGEPREEVKGLAKS